MRVVMPMRVHRTGFARGRRGRGRGVDADDTNGGSDRSGVWFVEGNLGAHKSLLMRGASAGTFEVTT
jgi:hypothetical protein